MNQAEKLLKELLSQLADYPNGSLNKDLTATIEAARVYIYAPKKVTLRFEGLSGKEIDQALKSHLASQYKGYFEVSRTFVTGANRKEYFGTMEITLARKEGYFSCPEESEILKPLNTSVYMPPTFIDLHFENPPSEAMVVSGVDHVLKVLGLDYREDQPREYHTGHGKVTTVHIKRSGARR